MNSQSSAVADALAWAATILAVVAAAVGLFVTGLYRDVPFWAEQARGIGLATPLLAVPILVMGSWQRAPARSSVASWWSERFSIWSTTT